MQSNQSAEQHAASFLRDNLQFDDNNASQRPHVTLTFAQSKDGKIAGANKSQLALSGSESMLMTHHLRTLHDGILVGIGTVLNDNPQLNARLLPQPPPVSKLPRPIVLDSNLRMSVDSKLISNYNAGIGRQPLVVSSSRASAEMRQRLEEAGVEVIQVDHESSAGMHDWTIILKQIREAGVQRLMVEGGAGVIDSLMQQPHLIDALLVTIAPIIVGPEGFGFNSQMPDDAATAATTQWAKPCRADFGKDEVVLWQKQ